jgi:hypothetical protein
VFVHDIFRNLRALVGKLLLAEFLSNYARKFVKSCPAALAKMLRIELIGQGVALARLLSHFLPEQRGGNAKEEREHSNRHKTYCSLQAFGPGLIAT